MRFVSLCTFLLLPSALCAQSIVSPSHFANVEGNTYDTQMICTSSTPAVYLEIHDDLQGPPRTINSISFRRDGIAGQTSAIPAYSVLCDIFVSTAAKTSAAPDKTFANNHGTDKAQVASFKLVQFPATPAGGLLRDWDYKVPFSQPFAFGGAAGLCWEIRVSSRTNSGAFYLDYAYSSNTNPAAYTDLIGTGCKTTGLTSPMYMSGSSSPNWPQSTMTFNYNGSSFPKNALLTLGIGNSSTSWSGLPLPYELPGTAIAPSGACTVYNNWLITIPQLSNANGQMSAQLGVNILPAYNGGNLFAQAIAIDTQANKWGVVMSGSVQSQILSPFIAVPVGDVYSTNLSGTGSPRANYGFVVKFE